MIKSQSKPDQDLNSGNYLQGRKIVVIGGTGGLGKATAHHLISAGAKLIVTGRKSTELEDLAALGATVYRLDLREDSSINGLAGVIDSEFGGVLDGLVAASGVYGPIGRTRSVDLQLLTECFDTNLVSVLKVIQLCAPALDRSQLNPSVALFSGGGATGPFPRYSAYALSKIAITRLVENLALEEPAWRVNAVAPGFVATEMHKETLKAGPEFAGDFYKQTEGQIDKAVSPDIAASLVGFLMSEAGNGISGRLISAVWDPWHEKDCQELLTSDKDFGRLRRIDKQFYAAITPE